VPNNIYVSSTKGIKFIAFIIERPCFYHCGAGKPNDFNKLPSGCRYWLAITSSIFCFKVPIEFQRSFPYTLFPIMFGINNFNVFFRFIKNEGP